MKVHHRPVLDSDRLQIGQFFSIFYATVPARRQKKKMLAVAVIGCNTADIGKLNDHQFCSHVFEQE